MRKQQTFPTTHPNGGSTEHGMNLRDYFAGQALANCFQQAFETRLSTTFTIEDAQTQIAEVCYEMADKMLAQREKG